MTLTATYSLSDRVRDLITPDRKKIGGRGGIRWAVIAHYSDGRRSVIAHVQTKRAGETIIRHYQRVDAKS